MIQLLAIATASNPTSNPTCDVLHTLYTAQQPDGLSCCTGTLELGNATCAGAGSGIRALVHESGALYPVPAGKFVYYTHEQWSWYDYVGSNGACDWYIEDVETNELNWVYAYRAMSPLFANVTGHLRCVEVRPDDSLATGFYLLSNSWRPQNQDGKIDFSLLPSSVDSIGDPSLDPLFGDPDVYHATGLPLESTVTLDLSDPVTISKLQQALGAGVHEMLNAIYSAHGQHTPSAFLETKRDPEWDKFT